MTRKQFEARAIREAERRIGVPPGWWGTWQRVTSPTGAGVEYSPSRGWKVLDRSGLVVSCHDSRQYAIGKARKL